MKKIILLIVTTFSIISIIPSAFAYETYTVFSDYTDFPEQIYNQTPKSFNVSTTMEMIDVYSNTRNVRVDMTLRNDTERRLYIDINLSTIGTSPIITYNDTFKIQEVSSTSNIGSIGYNIRHGSPTFNQSQLEIEYSIGGFDGTYEYLSGTIITPYIDIAGFQYRNISQEIDHNFTLLNEIYSTFNYDTYNNGYQYGYEIGFGEGYNNGIESLPDEIVNAYGNGYDRGKEVYGFYYNEQWITAEQFGNIRFQLGLDENPTKSPLSVLFNGLASLFGVGLAFVLQLGSIELMGISLNMILGIGLLLVGLIAILGLIFGGK